MTFTWQQFYDLFNYIVEKHFPDEEMIENCVDSLKYIFGDIPEFKTAYEKWMEYQKWDEVPEHY